MNDVAYTYDRPGRVAEAEQVYEEALALSRRITGSEHPDTLLIQNNLGAFLADAGELDRAEALLRQTLGAC